MPEDRLAQLFEQIARADVAVPPADRVLARGRQRRRRARLRAAAMAAVLLVAAGLGARQLTGAAANNPPASRSTSPAPTRPGTLPPPGTAPLIIALDGSSRFLEARAGSSARPVPVPQLSAVDGGPTVLAANPAGGWVVTYPTDPGAAYGSQPTRLALVTVTGRNEPFGPVFRRSSVTSAAVSPDASRIAIAILGPNGSSSVIQVRPMPGQHGQVRTWRLPPYSGSNIVSLSWAPDGRRLSYIAGFQTAGGLQGSLETMDTTAPGSTAPGPAPLLEPLLAVPPQKPPATCVPDAVAWLRSTGRLYALEDCGNPVTGQGREILIPVNPRSGRDAGPAQVIARQVGCGSPGLAPSSDGSRVLISYCGMFIDDNGTLTALRPAGLVAAAFAGFTVRAG